MPDQNQPIPNSQAVPAVDEITIPVASQSQNQSGPKQGPPAPDGTSFPFIGLGEEGSVVPPSNLPPVITPSPKKKFGGKRVIATILGLLVLVGGIGAGIILTRQRQEIREKAAGGGKQGCSNTCSGDPPSCSGDTTNGSSCSSVTVSGMPDSMNAWGVVNPTYNQAVNCVARDSQKADCSCQITGGVPYCWIGLESLLKNADNQGHRWAMYVYDKTTNQLKSGGPTKWILYDDNPDKKGRWGNSFFFSTDSVLHCGERNEYREQADVSSPGSWVETGQVIYAEPAGCGTPTTPPATAQCLNIQAFDTNWTKITDLSKLKVGDKVRFTAAGSGTSGSFDKARFTVNGTLRPEVTQKRPSTEEFYDEYTIPAGTTTFTVKAELHHSSLGWL